MSVNEYKLPDVGEGLTEAEIVSWKVKVGDVIKVNDVVVEIETAKSLVELPSPYAGTVQAILVEEGTTVEVGTPMVRIGDGAVADGGQSVDGGAGGEGVGEVEEEPMKTLVGYGPRATEAKRRPRRGSAKAGSDAGTATHLQVQGAFAPGGAQTSEVVDADEPVVPADPVASAAQGVSERVLAKPPVRKLAKDSGVDLGSLTPTGPDGTVTRADVESAVEAAVEMAGTTTPSGAEPTTTAPPLVRSGERERREPIKGVRKIMGQAMVDSAFTLPHVTEWITVDVTSTMKFVERLKARRAFSGVKVSPLLVVAKAVCLAARRTPEVNAYWDEQAQEIVFKNYVNLGIAAATPRGLVVPNVKDADSLSMVELANALNELIATARSGKVQPAQTSGGTFTITNVGVFGVDAGTPIINTGESAILAFGAIRKQPWVRTKKGKDKIVPRFLTTLALSFDHRFVDGEKGSRFIADVAAVLEDPANALLF